LLRLKASCETHPGTLHLERFGLPRAHVGAISSKTRMDCLFALEQILVLCSFVLLWSRLEWPSRSCLSTQWDIGFPPVSATPLLLKEYPLRIKCGPSIAPQSARPLLGKPAPVVGHARPTRRDPLSDLRIAPDQVKISSRRG
jgi:hypothetical protein